jgi:hypothetical protein
MMHGQRYIKICSILFIQKEDIWKGSMLIKAEKHLFSHLVHVQDKRKENS